MSTDPMPPAVPDTPDEPARPARPRTVDWAVYLIIASAIFSIAFGVARNLSDAWVFSNLRKLKTYDSYSDARLHDLISHSKTGSMVQTIVAAAVLVVLAKFVRDGKGWARWTVTVLLVLPFLPTGFVYLFQYLFVSAPIGVKLTAAATSFAAISAVSMMFVRPSRPYFRKPGRAGVQSPFANLLRPRPRPVDGPTEAPADAQIEAPTQPTGEPATDAPARRGTPRPKSRRGTTE